MKLVACLRACARSLVWGAAGLALAAASSASAACQLGVVAEFPVTMDGNAPLVAAVINGKPVRFLVDTGSAATLLARPAAAELGLQAFTSSMTIYGVGGGDRAGQTTIREFKLGSATVHNMQMIVSGPGLRSGQYVGLLGEDFLSRTDVELDFARGVIRLVQPKDCAGDQVVYWGKAYSVAPIAPSNNAGTLEVYVTLNGQRVIAEMDSGAYTSVVTTAAAEHAGVTPHSEGVEAAGLSSGLGKDLVETSVAVFPTFSIGDETIRNAKLRIADLFAKDTEVRLGSHVPEKAVELPSMLLGADFIRAHRVYIARSQGKIYFSYNGGPIFQVRGRRSDTAPAQPTAAPANPPRP